ncbi:MAG: DUF2269 domain-containing protein [Actinomycetota bacterium]|nr:DUF2269 domain-containing protein [Actinomycetota bacterium]
MTLYEFLKFVHVLLAIVAVGFNASYGIWLARAAKEPEHELHVLKGIKVLDDRFANPAYALLLVLGIWMVLIGPWEFTTFWILAALILYAVVALVAATMYSPTLRRQIALLENGGARSAEYAALARRAGVLGGVLGALVVAIVFLMVIKPTL